MKKIFCKLSLILSMTINAQSVHKKDIMIPSNFKKAVKEGGVYDVIAETPYLKLSSLQEKGAKYPWQFVERKKGQRGAAFVIAITEDRELILGQQRRIPVQSEVLGLPGGLIGDKDPDVTILETAKSELKEETGYLVDLEDLVHVNTGPSSAGLTSELHHIVLAKVRVKNYAQMDLEDSEKYAKLRPVLIKLSEIETELEELKASGVMVDNKVYQALYYLSKYGLN